MAPDRVRYEGLSITTRGIGLGTCNLCYIAAAADIEAPVYAMYRAFLGLAEAKVQARDMYIEGNIRERRYNCQVMPYMLKTSQNVTIVPSPIKNIIDDIDVITHNGTTYTPLVAAQVRCDGRLVPRPENLLLSNLREVVVALSSPDTPAAYRAAFKANCPIPGAVWAGDLLLNADEIIPPGYNLVADLSDDMWPLHVFLIAMQEKYPLMASGPLSRKGAHVSMAALISNHMGDVRAKPRNVGEPLQEYCRRCHPQGSLGPYYRLEEMSDADILAGQMALLGELPNVCALGKPLLTPVLEVHAARQGQLHRVRLHMDDVDDYVITLMLNNEALFSPSAPKPARGDAAAAPAARNSRGPRNRRRNQNE